MPADSIAGTGPALFRFHDAGASTMRLQFPPLHHTSNNTTQPSQKRDAEQARTPEQQTLQPRLQLVDPASCRDFDIEPYALVERIVACLPSELENLARREAVDGWALIHTEIDERTPGGILASFGRSRSAERGHDSSNDTRVAPGVERAVAASIAVEQTADSPGTSQSALLQLDPDWIDLAALQPGFDFFIHSVELVALFGLVALAGRLIGPGLVGRLFPIMVFLRFWSWSHNGRRSADFWREAASLARQEGREEALRWHGVELPDGSNDRPLAPQLNGAALDSS